MVAFQEAGFSKGTEPNIEETTTKSAKTVDSSAVHEAIAAIEGTPRCNGDSATTRSTYRSGRSHKGLFG